jgi:hypothetical protein
MAGKRTSIILDKANHDDIETIKVHLGIMDMSQAVRWALHEIALQIRAVPAKPLPDRRPMTRPAPKPGAVRYTSDEENDQ